MNINSDKLKQLSRIYKSICENLMFVYDEARYNIDFLNIMTINVVHKGTQLCYTEPCQSILDNIAYLGYSEDGYIQRMTQELSLKFTSDIIASSEYRVIKT
jgi:hypothetical protein